jgi:acyl carrier protein
MISLRKAEADRLVSLAGDRTERTSMHNDAELATQVTNVILRQLHASRRRIGAGTRLMDDLGADSIALVELTIVLEETFDIDIPDAEADKIRTVRDAVMAVEKCLRAVDRAVRS